MRERRHPKSGFTRENWLALGLEALAESGPAAITLEALTRRAGKTKGSFYHHFKDQRAFILALLALWRERSAQEEDLLATLDPALERALRRLDDPEAAAFIMQTDAERIDRLRARHPAPESPAAADYATLLYAAYIGSLTLPEMTPAHRNALLKKLTEDMIEAHWRD